MNRKSRSKFSQPLEQPTNGFSGFEKFLNSLGRLIQQRRVDSGKTQEDLARVLDINRSSIGNYECGRRNMTLKQLFDLAEAMDVILVVKLERVDGMEEIEKIMMGVKDGKSPKRN